MSTFLTSLHRSRLYEYRMSRNRNKDLKRTPDTLVETTEPDTKRYDFKFENLVLAGGGAKGVAYCGVARALEKHGILKKIKRFAGTSAGSIVAALLCIGFTTHDIEEIMQVDMKDLLYDSWIQSNKANLTKLFSYYGFHHANKFSKFIEEVIAIKTGEPDITFKKVFEMFNKELCIMVTNAYTMSAEYCHKNTTPDMPISKAIRMSISIPVELTPFPFGKDCVESLYIDGGVLCNYPISCFDERSILYLDENLVKNLPPESYSNPSKCQTTNLATLGCLVYAEDEYHPYRDQIEKKCSVPIWIPPETKLARRKDERIQKNLNDLHERLRPVTTDILTMFSAGSGGKKEFSLGDFEQIFKKYLDKVEEPEAEHDACRRAGIYFKVLYGADVDANMIFNKIEKEEKSKVTHFELAEFADKMSSELFIMYQSEMLKWEKHNWVFDFYKRLFIGLMTATMTNFFKADDVARTVGINTGYIKMMDFDMEDGDKQFLINQGQRSTEEFLKQFVHDHHLTPDPDCYSEREVTHHETSLSAENLNKIKKAAGSEGLVKRFSSFFK